MDVRERPSLGLGLVARRQQGRRTRHVNDAVAHITLNLAQRLADTRPGKTQPRVNFILRAVRRANDRVALFGQESVRHPIQRVPDVHAEVLVRIYLLPLTHDESLEGPVTLTNLKFPRIGITEIVERADFDFRRLSHAVFRSTERL